MSLTLPMKMPRIYRGWWVVSAPFLAAALGTGAGQYGFGIFIEPLEETFGWSRAQISASLSFTAVGSLLAPFLGWVIDRYGAKPVIAISLAMVAVSFLVRPMMTELWHWYALSLLQYAGYTGAAMLPAGKLVGIWFRRTRGRVMGLTAMGNNFGGLVMPPVMGWMLLMLSWEATYVGLGVISALLVVYTMVLVKDFPSRGDTDAESVESSVERVSHVTGRSVSEALRDRTFYAITLAVTLGTFTYSAIIPQIIPHLLDGGATLAVASLVLSMYAIAGMVGKFLMGLLAERITSRYALMANFVGQSVFLVAMIWADNPIYHVDRCTPAWNLQRRFWGAVPTGGAGRLRHPLLRQHHGADKLRDARVVLLWPDTGRRHLRHDGELHVRFRERGGDVRGRRALADAGATRAQRLTLRQSGDGRETLAYSYLRNQLPRWAVCLPGATSAYSGSADSPPSARAMPRSENDSCGLRSEDSLVSAAP